MKRFLLAMVPIFGLAALFIFVFWPLLQGQVYLNTGVIYSDLWLFNYPLKDWYRELLLSGRLPFWTNLVGNGYPVFAEGQVGALYPFHLILFRLFPTPLAFNLNIILHYFLAATLTYTFARVSLRLSRLASILAAIIYSLSGFFITHTHQINILMVISYLPLILMSIERLISTKRISWSFVLALVVSLQILAGHIEMFYYTSLLGGIFFVVSAFFLRGGVENSKTTVWRSLVFFVAAYILGVGIAMAQILPTWELTRESQRAEGLTLESASSTTWPLNTLSLFVNSRAYDLYRTEPGYHPLTSTTVNIMALYGYVGILPLVLTLLAIVFFRKRFVVIFGILLFLAFAYGFGRSTQFFTILWEVIPGLKFFRYPVKILFFIEFCLAILAAYGFEFVQGKFFAKKGLALGIIAAVALVGISFVDLYANNILRERKVVAADEWLRTPETAEFLGNEIERVGSYRVYSHGTNNIDYQMARVPEMQVQFQNLLPVDFNMISGLAENREWFVLFLARQSALNNQRTSLNTEKGELGLTNEFKRSLALQNTRFLVADLPIIDPDLQLVKMIPFSQDVDHYAYFAGAEGAQTVTVPAKGVYVYEFSAAFPRATFVSGVREVSGPGEAFEAVFRPAFDPRKEVVLEESYASVSGSGTGRADIVSDSENSLTVSVNAEDKGYLVLADTYYPGWKAYVDGQETSILKANYAFRAVAVPAGRHDVTFSFEPTHWRVGFAISGISLAITLGGLGVATVMELRKRHLPL